MIGKTGNKGFVGLLMFLLPFLLIFGGFVVTGYIISLLKLPLAIVAGVIAFIFSPGYVEKYLDVGRYYSLALGGLIGGIVALFIYSLPIFWIFVALGLTFAINGFIYMYTGINPFTELKNLVRGMQTEQKRK